MQQNFSKQLQSIWCLLLIFYFTYCDSSTIKWADDMRGNKHIKQVVLNNSDSSSSHILILMINICWSRKNSQFIIHAQNKILNEENNSYFAWLKKKFTFKYNIKSRRSFNALVHWSVRHIFILTICHERIGFILAQHFNYANF